MENVFKVIVAGGRDFTAYSTLSRNLDKLLSNVSKTHKIVIISGGASGADKLGEDYANARGYSTSIFEADWDAHGKAAGYIRNRKMAENADALVAFWDGKSKGTKHMIEEAEKRGLKVRVIRY